MAPAPDPRAAHAALARRLHRADPRRALAHRRPGRPGGEAPASELHARLTNADIEEIFQAGLREYLTACLADIGELGQRLQRVPGGDMRLRVDHVTEYVYEAPVRLSTQYLRLTPRDSARRKVLEWKLEAPAAPTRTLDGYGNVLHVLTLDRPTQAIRIRAIGVVETRALPDEGPDPVPLSPRFHARIAAHSRRRAARRVRRSTGAAPARRRAWPSSRRRF